MNKIVRNLILGSILMSGTQCIHLSFSPFSIFQIMLMITAVFATPQLLTRLNVQNMLNVRGIAVLWAVSSILAFITSINPSWAKSYLLLGLMSTFIFLLIPAFFGEENINLLLKTLIRSQYIVIPFSILNYVLFYNVPFMPEEIPLGAGMSIHLGQDALDRGTAGGEMRLMLPYATPPVLSIVMAMCITMLIFSKDLFHKYTKIALIFIFGTILIFTGSRTGMMGLLLILPFLVFNGDLKKILSTLPIKWRVLVLILCFTLIFVLIDNNYFQKMIVGRFSSVDNGGIDDDRHYLVPLDGFLIWIKSLSNFIFGIGFGSSAYMKGDHTFLPPYFLNSYITLLAERGLLGLVILLRLVKYLVRLYKERFMYSKNIIAFIYSVLVGMSSCFFYEGLNCYFLIFALAVSFVLPKYKKNNIS